MVPLPPPAAYNDVWLSTEKRIHNRLAARFLAKSSFAPFQRKARCGCGFRRGAIATIRSDAALGMGARSASTIGGVVRSAVQKQKARARCLGFFVEYPGRGERIRTSGLYVPNVALYQAKLHPVLALRAAASSDVAVHRISAQF